MTNTPPVPQVPGEEPDTVPLPDATPTEPLPDEPEADSVRGPPEQQPSSSKLKGDSLRSHGRGLVHVHVVRARSRPGSNDKGWLVHCGARCVAAGSLRKLHDDGHARDSGRCVPLRRVPSAHGR